jgi:hypothetical protein
MPEQTFRCVDCREVLPVRLLVRNQHQARCKGCNHWRFYAYRSSACPGCGERKDARAALCLSCRQREQRQTVPAQGRSSRCACGAEMYGRPTWADAARSCRACFKAARAGKPAVERRSAKQRFGRALAA